MTLQYDVPDDVLGLTGTFPRPGWIVLDAIRDRRFTGEIVFHTSPEVLVYADRGRIYLAERETDPSLGARLVDAGALNAAQREHGSLRIGDAEHLGRLFERVPSVDRHAVLVTAERMTEECLGWLATQRIASVEATPYRHHPSGVHRWERPFGALDLAPGDPLPAPSPDMAPVDLGPPEPLFTPVDAFDADDMIHWNEPSWLDERLSQIEIAERSATQSARADQTATAERPAPTVADVEFGGGDWIDQLHAAGLPEQGSDPLASPVRLPALGAEPIDRFELIWPSGEVDEQFGAATPESFPHPDIDRAGRTARLVRDGGVRPLPEVAETAGTGEEPDGSAVGDEAIRRWLADEAERDSITDEVVLAVRRAVASIETGSLAARRRLADAPHEGSTLAPESGSSVPVPPGRVAVRVEPSGAPTAGSMRSGDPAGGSVFDDLAPKVPAPAAGTSGASDVARAPTASGGDEHRKSALRRLIGSLRRH